MSEEEKEEKDVMYSVSFAIFIDRELQGITRATITFKNSILKKDVPLIEENFLNKCKEDKNYKNRNIEVLMTGITKLDDEVEEKPMTLENGINLRRL